MRSLILLMIAIIFFNVATFSQSPALNSKELLSELAENGCKCVDSIHTYNRSQKEVARDISRCINEQVTAYQLGSKLLQADPKGKGRKKKININIETDESSDEYKSYYYEMERYMVDNCPSLKNKLAGNEKQTDKSFSKNEKAKEFYAKGMDEQDNENYQKAATYFEKAVKEDPEFAFAWDNLGVSYRKLNEYDKAIEAYETSLKIDSNGVMPLQNIAVVYLYQKQYDNAISAYERLARLDQNNPEIYYGIGNIYATKKEYEKGLDYMCKAYHLYVQQKSPYRSDAEKIISLIHTEMKKQGSEDKFNQILKANNISPQ